MRKILLLSLAAMLAGCFKVGPDYQRPEIATPKNWRFAEKGAKDTTNLKWWEQLGDPALNRLVERGIQQNLDLKIAVANVDRFMGLYGSTRSNLFPQISGEGNYLHRQASGRVLNLPDGSGLNPKETDYARLAATMNWELDVWGALRRANEAAMGDMLAQDAFKRAVILTLVSQIAQTYIQLRTLDMNLEITRNVVATLAEELRIAQVRFREGYTSELEVNQVESEYERRAALIPAAEQEIALAEHALKVLLGENPGSIQRGRTIDEIRQPAVPAGLPSEILARRPDIEQAEQELIAANARIGVARGLYFPRISLTGDVGQLSSEVSALFTPGANFWSIGSAVLTPLFTAGKIAGQVQAAEAVQRATLANYQRAIISAFREFEDALVSTQKTVEQEEKQRKRVTAVQNYVNLAQVRYDEGYTDFITLLDALRQLYEAQIDRLQAQSAKLTSSVQLYRAMGGGWVVQADATLPKPLEPSVFP
ncbi:efflux transporter outer membrane subunit [Methyloterricola oryzae]|uniref:efflux transporter outer membrane subunit n=1 Tax=Methyloterricola oryzae TaxID=1495050 RepID=UPI0005EBB2EC|nr:efflux transporter outer membrane subunit [Methyloterricola oryzae]